ncbi:hypothetical protein [Thaumasiovibrio subtropicus]|uniref:hypothetical protein n=1 Tax=Thaumasiovibrio subtropicus TaxID=1891207 RepID=UPI000B363C03|nr:hypothetical protein [Thaumasiovibrio subtropicus]
MKNIKLFTLAMLLSGCNSGGGSAPEQPPEPPPELPPVVIPPPEADNCIDIEEKGSLCLPTGITAASGSRVGIEVESFLDEGLSLHWHLNSDVEDVRLPIIQYSGTHASFVSPAISSDSLKIDAVVSVMDNETLVQALPIPVSITSSGELPYLSGPNIATQLEEGLVYVEWLPATFDGQVLDTVTYSLHVAKQSSPWVLEGVYQTHDLSYAFPADADTDYVLFLTAQMEDGTEVASAELEYQTSHTAPTLLAITEKSAVGRLDDLPEPQEALGELVAFGDELYVVRENEDHPDTLYYAPAMLSEIFSEENPLVISTTTEWLPEDAEAALRAYSASPNFYQNGEGLLSLAFPDEYPNLNMCVDEKSGAFEISLCIKNQLSTLRCDMSNNLGGGSMMKNTCSHNFSAELSAKFAAKAELPLYFERIGHWGYNLGNAPGVVGRTIKRFFKDSAALEFKARPGFKLYFDPRMEISLTATQQAVAQVSTEVKVVRSKFLTPIAYPSSSVNFFIEEPLKIEVTGVSPTGLILPSFPIEIHTGFTAGVFPEINLFGLKGEGTAGYNTDVHRKSVGLRIKDREVLGSIDTAVGGKVTGALLTELKLNSQKNTHISGGTWAKFGFEYKRPFFPVTFYELPSRLPVDESLKFLCHAQNKHAPQFVGDIEIEYPQNIPEYGNLYLGNKYSSALSEIAQWTFVDNVTVVDSQLITNAPEYPSYATHSGSSLSHALYLDNEFMPVEEHMQSYFTMEYNPESFFSRLYRFNHVSERVGMRKSEPFSPVCHSDYNEKHIETHRFNWDLKDYAWY